MGRNKKQYKKTMREQVYDRLRGQLAFGESKHEAKRDGSTAGKIYSYASYETYKQWGLAFVKWLAQEHPDETSLKKCKRYVPAFLASLADENANKGRGYSASTLATATASLNKLYQLGKDDPYRFTPPERLRSEITRSRGKVANDKHFSEVNHQELVDFAKATGARRTALERLTGNDFWTRDRMASELRYLRSENERGVELPKNDSKRLKAISEALRAFPDKEYFVYFQRDKGGRDRMAPIVGSDEQQKAVVERFRATSKNEKVWLAVPSAMDVHSYRSDYATALYREYARPIDEIPRDRVHEGTGRRYQSDVYHCRGDLAGVKLDKAAMRKVSIALGHNRLEVVASHYIRNI